MFTRFNPGTTLAEATEILGINSWYAEKVQYYSPEHKPVENAFYLRHSVNKQTLCTQTVSERYRETPHSELIAWFDALLTNNPSMTLHSGAIIDGGKQIVIQAFLDKKIEIQKEDFLHPYVVFILDHSGQSSDRILQLTNRLICTNQLPLIMKKKDYAKNLRIRHSSKASETRERAKEVLADLENQIDLNVSMYKQWSVTPLTLVQFEQLVNTVLDCNDAKKEKPFLYQEICHSFYHGDGNNGKTLWDFVNAVTQQLRDSVLSKDVENRIKSILLGSGYNRAVKTAKVAQQVTRYGF